MNNYYRKKPEKTFKKLQQIRFLCVREKSLTKPMVVKHSNLQREARVRTNKLKR